MAFGFDIAQEEGLFTISLSGNLIGKQQADEIFSQLKETSVTYSLAIDMGEMEYMNSTGLSVLINLLTQTRSQGGEVVIANVPEKINKLLIITKLNSVFNIAENIEEAKKQLQKVNES